MGRSSGVAWSVTLVLQLIRGLTQLCEEKSKLSVMAVTPCHLWTSGPAPDPPSLVPIHVIWHHSPQTPY